MFKRTILFVFITILLSPVFANDDNINDEDIVLSIIEEINLDSCELINDGIYDNGIIYEVYKLNDSVIITVSVDENGALYAIGNAETNEAMQDILDYLTGIYTEPIPYINGDGFTAYFHDTENLYIKESFADYIGTFTIYGNHMFVEEVITQEKIIIQRQWCTPAFYETNTIEAGKGWGFIASWDTVEYEESTLPSQYTVRQWSNTGDCLSAIAGLPFIYGDPFQWRLLYEANREKLPNPNNPHLIFPGTVLDIPSLRGEFRSGMWNPDAQ